MDNKSQILHGSGPSCVFEQAHQTDAKHFCTCSGSLRVQSWGRKPMHGQYRHLTEKPPVDMKETYRWLKSLNLPAATEGLVVAAQDQALRTRYYKCNILHRDVSPTSCLCSVGPETVDHIAAGCSALAPMDYTDRHNQVASIIHLNICHHFGVPVKSRWYQHHSDRLVEIDNITMMWDTTIPTARKISATRPDICFRNKKTNTCLLIDISCPVDGNIARKQAEKLTKYSDLWVEVSCMWQCRTLIVPVVLGALGTVHAGCPVAGHYSRSSQPPALTETVLLGSTRILRKDMSSV